jgi:putative endonuclease
MSGGHFTYILASKPRGALFVGATGDLVDRVLEHKHNLVDGLTSLYAIHQLVYYEYFDETGPALLRKRELERLPRVAKLRLVESFNPAWRDLFDEIALEETVPD